MLDRENNRLEKIETERDELKIIIEQLEYIIQAKEMEHKYDMNMIDEVKGEAVKLYKEIQALKKRNNFSYGK